MTESDIRSKFIDPAILQSGWREEQICREKYFTDGRVLFIGQSAYNREIGKRADYILYRGNNLPIAVIEAKDNTKPIGGGLQQAIEYAQILNLPFAYSSNGDGFVEHDFLTGEEHTLPMEAFPTPQQLVERWRNSKQFTDEQISVVDTPYYTDINTHEPRYYQQQAINNTIEAIAQGKNRILIVMATGTGKTITAFQIIHRLRAAGLKKKILYLADRNILIDQTMNQDFRPFKKYMTKVQGATIDSAYEIYMALYHQLVSNDESVPDPFTQVKPDFFDLIIVDECHRGSAKDDSAWRKVLEYFSSATQIGMTATPKAEAGANNLDYFGAPIFTYSLRQGIQDGFLAPYRVTNSYINIDLQGYTPEADEQDIYGKEIEQRLYQRQDIGRSIAFIKRRKIVAWRITKMLHQIGRMTKTIVFCSDTDEAEAMREQLVTLNADLCKKNPNYVMRITGDDAEGKKQLDNFIDVDAPYPTIVTTSELLATGVDCKTCGLIVIDKEIGSMTEFKQIIGRGTRLRIDKGKWHLEILDFRNATAKFKDPDFDGDVTTNTESWRERNTKKTSSSPTKQTTPATATHNEKYVVEGENISINTEIVSILDVDGKTMRTESVIDYTRRQLLKRYATLQDFINNWTAADRKKAIVDELKEYNVLIDAVREKNPSFANADIFDIICHVAFDQPTLTRRERANNVIKRNYFAKYGVEARKVLEALLDKYADYGILNLEDPDILRNEPFSSNIGTPPKIMKLFGGPDKFEQAMKELETEIYKQAI